MIASTIITFAYGKLPEQFAELNLGQMFVLNFAVFGQMTNFVTSKAFMN